MANRSPFGYLEVSGNSMITHDASGGTFSSDWKAVKADWIGVALEAVVSGGTSPQFTPTIEVTPDEGTNVYSLPADNNSQTAAAMSAITATGNHMKYWLQPFNELANWQWRVKFTASGTLSTFTITGRFFNRVTAEELR